MRHEVTTRRVLYEITLVNYPGAPHAFDLFHDHPETGRILQQALDFLQAKLR